ncbi:MAG: DUF86 domain-containing protein [Candidatus Methylomirabilis sp.]|nr:DUF86 domain-containing protein [Deltaproteobacteria bacterium]
MTRRDPRAALHHMRDHAREAVDMARGRTRADLDEDRSLNLSLVRLLEIVGEAAGRVPPERRAEAPAIPWPQIVGLRNRLIHGYDDVDFNVLWAIVTEDLPPLIGELDRVLATE